MERIEIPKSVGDWTLSLVEALVDAEYFETDWFDFKEFLSNNKEPRHGERICITACAFANANGGFMVFGVSDRSSRGTKRDRIVGIDKKADLAKIFGDQIKTVEPTIFYTPQNPPINISKPAKVIFAVHIPKSAKAPHAFIHDNQCRFYKRTNQGNEPMSYGEIVDAFNYRDHLRSKLTFLSSQLSNIEYLLPHIYSTLVDKEHYSHPLVVLDYNLLDALLADLYPIVRNDTELLHSISRLKFMCMTTNGLISKLPWELAQRPQEEVAEEYNRNIGEREPETQRLINSIQETLLKNYDVEKIPPPLFKMLG